jgi:hypothetical protein
MSTFRKEQLRIEFLRSVIYLCFDSKISVFSIYQLMHKLIVLKTTLVDLQLDAQNSYLFIYNTLIKILFMFRALPCSSSGGLRRNYIYAASGIVTLCR